MNAPPSLVRLDGGVVSHTDHLMTLYWNAAVSSRDPGSIRKLGEEIKAKQGALEVIMLIEQDAPAPTRSARQALAETWKAIAPSGVATIFLGQGIATLAGKSIMNGISLLSRTRGMFRSFTDLREGATWLSERCALHPDQIISISTGFLEHARATAPQTASMT